MEILKINNGNINDVFIIKIQKSKYIMRASDFNNDFECKILKLLIQNNINAPNILTKFKLHKKNIMIYKYIEGEQPQRIDKDFLKLLSKEIIKLHNVKQQFKKKEYQDNEESILKLNQYYNIAIKSKYLESDVSLIKKLYKEVKNINFEKLPTCIIHSDLKEENILINKNKIYLIDFGNTYIGNRLIDLIRVIMWFFIKKDNWDIEMIKFFISYYFKNSIQILPIEKENISLLIKYCILYNLLKDLYLYENSKLGTEYIEKNSLIWLETLKNKSKLTQIEEVFKNA